MLIHESVDAWIDQRIPELKDDDLALIINDIYVFRNTGIVPEGKFKEIINDFRIRNKNVSDVRLVEDSILYCAAIRFANNREKGTWIEEPRYVPYCSECGAYSDDATGEVGYCSHCGKAMKTEAVRITPELLKFGKSFGKWRYESENGGAKWQCSECNHVRINPICRCPICNTDMELPL